MNYVLIGKIHSPQGVKGDLYVSIFAEEAEWADQWETLHISDRDGEAPTENYSIQWSRVHQKQGRWGFVVHVDGVDDRNRAEELKGWNVYIPEEFLVSDEGEELFLREVLGFQVEDKTRGIVGEVIGFSGNSMQDILIIENKKGKFEVPFVSPIHLETDKENKKLIMDIPQGLVAGETL